MKKCKLFMLTIAFLIVATGINLTMFKEDNTAYADSNKYALSVGCFEYWKDSSGNYMYDDKDGVRHTIGKDDPSKYFITNHTYQITNIDTTRKVKAIYNLAQYQGDWKDLNYKILSQSVIRDSYLSSAVIDDVIYFNGTFPVISFYPNAPEDSQPIAFNKWRNFIATVIEYEQ